MSNRKPGDWDCACGSVNHSYRSKCYKCDRIKSVRRFNTIKSAIESAFGAINTWKCNCGEVNKEHATYCRGCQTCRHQSNSTQAPQSPVNLPVYATSSKCTDRLPIYADGHGCSGYLPIYATNSTQAPQSPVNASNDWSCECGSVNHAYRSKCYKCDRIKSVCRFNTIKSASDIPISNIPVNGAFVYNEIDDINDDKACKICFERLIDTRVPCGHICMCMVCANAVKSCPICRAPYNPDKDIQKSYLV